MKEPLKICLIHLTHPNREVEKGGGGVEEVDMEEVDKDLRF